MFSLIGMEMNDPMSWVITIIIAAITFYLAKFYYNVMSLPPGPFPLPILGNLLTLRGTKNHISIELINLYRKYGPVITFWFGPKPFVFIFHLELGRDAFKRNEFAGRPKTFLSYVLSNEKYSDVIFEDYGPRWESLRRVAYTAVRKYAISDRLAYLISDVVDDTVKMIIEKEGINKPFNPFTLIYFLFFNILASSAFGKRYAIDDPEFLTIKYYASDFMKEMSAKIVTLEFFPFLRPFYRNTINQLEKAFQKNTDLLKEKYRDHHKDYDEAIIRDFCDSLIFAKNEALKENKESVPYLKDESLAMTIFDLFIAGTDTSQHTFKWIVLLLANYPEMQNKMRNEIDSVIGDRMPVYDDRNNCHFTNAFIDETMRFKPIVPTGVFHKNLISTKIGDHKIPADMVIALHQMCIMNDPKHWTDPEVFNPNRFIENGKYLTQKPLAFIPFGTGRRVCLGEKMANTDLFLVLVRFLQATNGYTISLINGPGSADLEGDPNVFDAFTPKEYQILLKK